MKQYTSKLDFRKISINFRAKLVGGIQDMLLQHRCEKHADLENAALVWTGSGFMYSDINKPHRGVVMKFADGLINGRKMADIPESEHMEIASEVARDLHHKLKEEHLHDLGCTLESCFEYVRRIQADDQAIEIIPDVLQLPFTENHHGLIEQYDCTVWALRLDDGSIDCYIHTPVLGFFKGSAEHALERSISFDENCSRVELNTPNNCEAAVRFVWMFFGDHFREKAYRGR